MNTKNIQWFFDQPLWFTLPIIVIYIVLWGLFLYFIWHYYHNRR